MGKISWARVIVGGLVAGVLINVSEALLNAVVLADQWRQAMEALNKSGEFSGGQIAFFNLMGFVMGIALVWLYAAIRPRYGPGPKTAACAGLTFWFLAYLLPSVFQMAMDMWPLEPVIISLIWGLVEIVLAAELGGWLYKEQAAGETASAMAAGR